MRPVVARIAGRPLADRTHRVRVVVAAGDDAGSRRRAEARRVEVRVQDARVGDPLEVRRRDQAAEWARADRIRCHRARRTARSGRPWRRLLGTGHASVESSIVLPILPGNGVPCAYSTNLPSAMVETPIVRRTLSRQRDDQTWRVQVRPMVRPTLPTRFSPG